MNRADVTGERKRKAANYAWSVVVVAVATLAAHFMFPHFAPANLIMVYLLGVVLVAALLGRGPSVLAAVLSVATYDWLFVSPYHSFAVDDSEYLLTFAIMLAVALLTSSLVVHIGRQTEIALSRERHTATLYNLSRELSRAAAREDVIRIAEMTIGDLLTGQVRLLLPSSREPSATDPAASSSLRMEATGKNAAEWSLASGQIAGNGSGYFPEARAVYVPVTGIRGPVGVLEIFQAPAGTDLTATQRHLLEAIAGQVALTLERAALSEEAERIRIEGETERLRNIMLSSISHDLRTPLATIAGASSSLLEDEESFDPATRKEMVQSIWDEAEHLNRLVTNLLDMSRIESGSLALRKEWHPLEEVIGATLTVLRRRLRDCQVETSIPSDLPLVQIDGLSIEQVLLNLIENALKYSQAPGSILITATKTDEEILVSVLDRGPGLGAGAEERIFEKFYQASDPGRRGVGLGLAICRGVVEAHGGRIWAENRAGGGAAVRFTLPLTGPAPTIDVEAEESA